MIKAFPLIFKNHVTVGATLVVALAKKLGFFARFTLGMAEMILVRV